eukprot:1167298-Pleurochrysis_carterae.AAC.1
MRHVEPWLQPRYASTAFLSAAMKVSMCTNSAVEPGSCASKLGVVLGEHVMQRSNCSDCDNISARRLALEIQKCVPEMCSTGNASNMKTTERGLSD